MTTDTSSDMTSNSNTQIDERDTNGVEASLDKSFTPSVVPSVLPAPATSIDPVVSGCASERPKSFWTKCLMRECVAEALGTGMIVFWGTGAVMSAVIAGELVGLFQIAAVWIIAVTLAIACTASVSGAHLNPAVSIAFALLRPSPQFGWKKVPLYISAQMAGAVLASWMNLLMYASRIRAFEEKLGIERSANSVIAIKSAKCFGEYYLDPVTTAQAFLVEAFGTAVLVMVIFALTHPANDTMIHNVYIPPLIGMTVGGLISVLAPLTQAGFNPARDFGPRIVAYFAGWTGVAFDQAWLFIVAPIVGAPFGGMLIDWVLFVQDDDDDNNNNNNNNNNKEEMGLTQH